MQKRTKLAIIIIVGLLLLILGIYLMLSPYLAEKKASEPQPVPAVQMPVSNGKVVTPPVVTSTPIIPPVPTPDSLLRRIEDRAKATVERIGSGSSGNGFMGTQDVISDMTPNGAAEIVTAQQLMQKAHPASGPAFGISTRVASSHAESGKIDDARIIVSVDAIQYEDAGMPSKPTKTQAKRIKVTFLRQSSGGYLIDHLEWSDLSL